MTNQSYFTHRMHFPDRMLHALLRQTRRQKNATCISNNWCQIISTIYGARLILFLRQRLSYEPDWLKSQENDSRLHGISQSAWYKVLHVKTWTKQRCMKKQRARMNGIFIWVWPRTQKKKPKSRTTWDRLKNQRHWGPKGQLKCNHYQKDKIKKIIQTCRPFVSA